MAGTPTCAELQARLADAETALHKAKLGTSVVMVRQGEKQVQYNAGDLAALERYVITLRDQVAACTGDTTRPRRRALGFIPHDSNNCR